ncbi:hypothetical protein CONPUDRAFT_85011 [Coniophora puteana RWD-64-598 SS2]|uniref:Uncharacterized protein n=1 Tax=Coniophora puteana (strain RWD-64-598) TaxID=741705 RepID=A0A5M3MCA1_CONPW|nr:uncharacterized protein CONPUDRAFT_85011 [Coniophora puteana RWD-64-598 SS2]EIW76470.1 hypothetical protein CONPUDRAFT_85011 [Coniophora puteana RWD-64-598 SS2]
MSLLRYPYVLQGFICAVAALSAQRARCISAMETERVFSSRFLELLLFSPSSSYTEPLDVRPCRWPLLLLKSLRINQLHRFGESGCCLYSWMHTT